MLVVGLYTHTDAMGHRNVTKAGEVDAGNVVAIFVRILASLMMSIDTTDGTEVVARDVGVAPIKA